ncbi:MAG: archease [Thermoplasmata archaeon]
MTERRRVRSRRKRAREEERDGDKDEEELNAEKGLDGGADWAEEGNLGSLGTNGGPDGGEKWGAEEDGEGRGAGPAPHARQGRGAETAEGRRILELLKKHESVMEPPRRRGARPRARFELLEHTADVGVRAYGTTLHEAFENAALGMFSIITNPEDVAPVQEFTVEATAEDLKGLLHEWLSRLLTLSQINGVLFSEFSVELSGGEKGVTLEARAFGEPADPSRHAYKTEIKAVTRHMLEVREDPPTVTVLFDI